MKLKQNLILFIFTFLLNLSLHGATENQLQQYRNKAEELVQQGKFNEAVLILKQRAKTDEKAELLIGKIYRMTGQYKKALEILKKNNRRQILLRAKILFETGRLEESEENLEKLERSPESLLIQGKILYVKGEVQRAREDWNKVISFYQDMDVDEAEKAKPQLFIVFGEALTCLNRFEEANEIMLAQALEKDSKDLSALIFGGNIFAAKYDFPEARKYFRKALKLSPNNPGILAGLAKAKLDDPMSGGIRIQETVQLLNKSISINPRHELSRLLLGDTFFFDGLFNKAETQYKVALETNPASLRALGALYACAHLTFNKQAKAEIEKKALDISRKPAQFFYAAARRCEIQCQYPLAVMLCNKAYKANPSYWQLYTSLALGELRLGHYKQGSRFVKEGLLKDEYNIWLRNTKKLFNYIDKKYVVKEWGNLRFHVPHKTASFYLNYIAPLLQKAENLFEERYGTKTTSTINIEVYPRQDYFACRVLGLPDFPAQGVCFGKVIAVTVPPAFTGNFAISTWHEFAHVYTVTGSGYHIPRWFTEGISVREEGLCPVGGKRSYMKALGKAIASNNLPSFSDFDARFRRPKNPEELLTAYSLAPLAVEFIINRFGNSVLKAIIPNLRYMNFQDAFKKSTGTKLSDFNRDFHKELHRIGDNAAQQFAGAGIDTISLKTKLSGNNPDPKAVADLAWAYLKKGDNIDAETYALKMKTNEKFKGEALSILGIISQRRGEIEKAKQRLLLALKEKGRNQYGTLLTLASIAQHSKNTSKQADYLAQAWKDFPDLASDMGDFGTLGQLCHLWNKSGDKRLEEALTDLVTRDRNSAWARIRLFEILRKKGDRKGEMKILRQLVYMVPFNKDGRLNTELFKEVIDCAQATGYTIEAARAKKLLEADTKTK